MPASEVTPRYIFPLYPSDRHPILCLSFLRSLYVLMQKNERSDAIAVIGGRSLGGSGRLKVREEKMGKMGTRKQE
jgi:hypothetical protein